MANAVHTIAKPSSSMEILASRLRTIICSRSAQEAQCALIYRTPDEDPSDWDQIIAAIEETDGVHVITHDDGSAHITWDVPDNIQRSGAQIQHFRKRV